MYGKRKNPSFSRLSAILSQGEARFLQDLLHVVGDRVHGLIFDGLYVACHSFRDDVSVALGWQSEASPVKAWPSSSSPKCLPHSALCVPLPELSQIPVVEVDLGNCLLNAVMRPCFGGKVGSGLSAAEFHVGTGLIALASSTRQT